MRSRRNVPAALLGALLSALLLLGGCGFGRQLARVGVAEDVTEVFAGTASGASASTLTDPRIEQAPMSPESRAQIRGFLRRPNPKAFAFSPETGANRHAWGQPSVDAATGYALGECEAAAGSRCVLFAVNNEIVWRPGADAGAAAPAAAAAAAAAAVTPPPPPAPAPAVDAPPPAAAPAVAADPAAPPAAPSAPAAGGAPRQQEQGASAYLVGVFDLREGRTTLVQVVNPTRAGLRLYVAFLGQDGRPLTCTGNRLAAGGFVEVDARRAGVTAPLGVVKVVALAEDEGRPQVGVVGSRRLAAGGRSLTESDLHPVQAELLEPELPALGRLCRW